MKKQPNSQSCFVCGLENPFGLKMTFYDIAPGEVEAHYTVSKQFQSYPGVVHGGIVAAMMDEAVGRSQMGADPNHFMYTGQLTIRYRKPVPVEVPLRILGHARENRGKVAKAVGEIYDPNGTLLAEAEIVLFDVPANDLAGIDPESMGWRVYPD